MEVIIYRRTHTLVFSPEKRIESSFNTLIRKVLELRESNAMGASWPVFTALLNDIDPEGRKVLRLPPFIDENLIRSTWPGHAIEFNRNSWKNRKVAISFNEQTFPYRNSIQSDVVKFLTSPEEYPYSGRLVQAGTAVGKSYCAIRAWAHHGTVMLGTFAQMSHLANFKTEILKFTTVTEEEILVIDDGKKTIASALKRSPEERDKIKVILVLHRTIMSSLDAVIDGNNSVIPGKSAEIVELIFRYGIGLHISDESHLELRSLLRFSMMTNIRETFYLTATPKRTDWKEDILLKTQLPIHNAFVLVSKPRLLSIQLSFNSGPNEIDVRKSKNIRGYFDIPKYFDYLMSEAQWSNTSERITNLISTILENPNTGSIGVVVSGKIEFLEKTIELLKTSFPEKEIGNFSSKVKAGEKRNAELEKDIVVTTDKSFNGSVNPIKMTHLIYMAPITSEVTVEQISGRLRGENGLPCIFVDFYDTGFPSLIQQAKIRKTFLKRISLDVRNITYSPGLEVFRNICQELLCV